MKYSNETNQKLISIYINGSINKNQFSIDVLHNLFKDAYISNSSNYKDDSVYLTDSGKAYIEQILIENPQTRSGKILKWIKDNTLELIAILISIIALLKP